MEIIVARNSGFCYGVRRALQLARKTGQKSRQRIFSWGEIIHNPEVITSLQKDGILVADSLSQLKPGDTVLIRSHGISPAVYRALRKKKVRLVDATCPIVKKIQQTVDRLSRQSGEIIIVGNKNHPEIQGLLGYSRGKARVVENEEQARALPFRKKRAVLAQSTQDGQLFSQVVGVLAEKTAELQVFNTICQSTRIRQVATAELARRVEALLIIGGRNSSNTNKLYQISRRLLPRTYFIESAEEITPEMLRGVNKIGLSGGASTPPEVINKTVAAIRHSFQQNSHQEKVTHD
ncbi:MAG: 4-hydroxy-3-methylbut-2-enyl diphosphate reductase [Candidatus Saccharicenans subterraneus]|uniref:4-hydroxy-3-methylbut-2-enyl diphosphate reductase n=1 Tax=Candidatus Saccharicenans subterraneus TaxID=2508984 RepID=A0A3E2BKJ3_9BACT|nr:MAG: 4-hydroxy-3-methylbut-2-enyl diphosphate reductase [Candidatus Saccharicenans subterraneum]